MPLITVTYSSVRKAPSLKAEIASAVSDLTARILRKDPKVTAIIVKSVDAADWFAGGKSLAEQSLASFWLDVHVSEGTNTKDEKAAYLAALFQRMGELLGPLHEESYAHVDEVKGDAYGFGGLTQERRYIAGQLEVAPRKARREDSLTCGRRLRRRPRTALSASRRRAGRHRRVLVAECAATTERPVHRCIFGEHDHHVVAGKSGADGTIRDPPKQVFLLIDRASLEKQNLDDRGVRRARDVREGRIDEHHLPRVGRNELKSLVGRHAAGLDKTFVRGVGKGANFGRRQMGRNGYAGEGHGEVSGFLGPPSYSC